MSSEIKISPALEKDHPMIGKLMVKVYSNLSGFPSPEEQPDYYNMLANIGEFTRKESVELLVAKQGDQLLGAVVYIGDMKDYSSGGTATLEKNAAGFRLLAVDPKARGLGVGKKLTIACIDQAKSEGRKQVVIHTTESMQVAWGMYEKMGFIRSEDLDFEQSGLPVFGFRLKL
ncbi:Ribosomal protein S18 acetylase RimI [Ekhidna lutea]|uniref:Ribosomal protein S18 acetylase RimI n=1 Tax=Ekhidna lutea TaxID=447679 RepID=A0A239I0C7_EKHLU|nr:GNAT family N-acetyltransferase [Ekhidna lutea]SNS86852.1 Ribosomal protein S18 acetylase RimI [Ekhidna lutea]